MLILYIHNYTVDSRVNESIHPPLPLSFAFKGAKMHHAKKEVKFHIVYIVLHYNAFYFNFTLYFVLSGLSCFSFSLFCCIRRYRYHTNKYRYLKRHNIYQVPTRRYVQEVFPIWIRIRCPSGSVFKIRIWIQVKK